MVTLPSIGFGSQQIGGPVHTGATISVANHAAQACVAVIAGATLVQLRPAHNWLDLGMCWLGRGTRIIAPGVCVAEGIASAVADRARLRRAGLRTSRLDALLDGIDRGRQIESRWEEASGQVAPAVGPCAGGDRDTCCNAGMDSPHYAGLDVMAHCRFGSLA